MVARVIAVWAIAAGTALGQQLARDVSVSRGSTQYRWVWAGADGRRWETWAKLPTDAVKRATTQLRPYDPRDAENRVYGQMQATAAALSQGGGVTVQVRQEEGGFRYEIQATSEVAAQKVAAQLDSELKNATREVSKQDGFVSAGVTAEGELLMRDYSALARQYEGILKPLAEALRNTAPKNQGKRAVLEHLLDFVRSIPYSQEFQSGADLQTPVGMLEENRGDCDTKAVAAASLIGTVFPRTKLAFVVVPGHLMLGVEMAPAPGDAVIRFRGTTYVLAEASGPSMPPLGLIDPKHKRFIEAGQATVRLLQ